MLWVSFVSCWYGVPILDLGVLFFWWRRLVPVGDLDDLENYYGRDVYGVNSNRGVFHSRGFIDYMLGRIRPSQQCLGFHRYNSSLVWFVDGFRNSVVYNRTEKGAHLDACPVFSGA